ncbi:NAD(P)/FAD-dependent oxidoreductase [Kyrpidia spormannii]|uniref:NADH dehydrogenase-like protein YjlD n=2 Tax=Kyrpidia spormannii TaxID=2055160 RepID=A0ACA8ZAB2_9BACL|nr:NAD(P)/FAD-dependent oxidoreductase [Kyrpidia spormannii]CAB3392993.1 NADH dehydrogenase-like protein YjlD [Kyrpidia spormannii]CAB3393912.1 NADH dehydrogenase-like protein YjlD [Kyrpidia spormannii]
MEKQILILGAGYGGVKTACGLQRQDIPFALVNDQPYHQFTTLMHEVAGGRDHPDDYRIALQDLIDPRVGKIRIGTVSAIDLKGRRVQVDGASLEYDVLVVALGSETEFFGIPGLQKYSVQLWGFDSALDIRRRMVELVKKATAEHPVNVIVGGGGLTGVELTGELADWIPHLSRQYGVHPEHVHLILIEAMETIVPMLDVELQRRARQVLEQKGVQVRTGTKVAEVKEGQVLFDDHPPLSYSLFIWTGGVRGNRLLGESGFPVDRKGRVPVDPVFHPKGMSDVFVIGDCAAFPGPDGRPLPPTAQLATQMGDHLAQNIGLLLKGRPLNAFHPHLRGTLASLGRGQGIGEVGNWKLAGGAARFLKEANKARYLWSIGGWKTFSRKRGQIRWA